jgi:Holliday junction resolvasome RuvABC endonuclease subunit
MKRGITVRYRRLLAVDPSLTASGWALFDVAAKTISGIGLIVPPGPEVLLAERLSELQNQVSKLLSSLNLRDGDLVVCEGPAPLVDNPQSALKVEHVRGIFESLARERSVSVPGRLNPRTVQSELLGLRGKQLARTTVKGCARETVQKLYGKELSSLAAPRKKMPQDIIDAILIGTLALSKVSFAERSGITVQAAFAQHEGREKLRRGTARRARGDAVWSESDLEEIILRR